MQIPDTPEALFEALADDTVREYFPQHDQLPIFYQKLLRILHAELTKGELTDDALRMMLFFIITVWRSFNRRSVQELRHMIEISDDVDVEWFDQYAQLGRIDTYLAVVGRVVDTLPALAHADNPNHPIVGRYRIQGPGD